MGTTTIDLTYGKGSTREGEPLTPTLLSGSLEVQRTFYHDADGDSYTNNDDTQDASDDPDGSGTAWVDVPTEHDCDDGNPSVHPGATEDCANGTDDDCDGLIDCQDSDCPSPTADAGGPYSGHQDESVTLDGSGSTDPAATIIGYAWWIDDFQVYAGTKATVEVDLNSYTVGTHEATLVVTNSIGCSDDDTVPLTATAAPEAVLSGHVELQGRADWSGILVMASPPGISQTTGQFGTYTLPVRVSLSPVTLTATIGRYLDARRTVDLVSGTLLIPSVRLPGGDVTDDHWIDISDLAMVGGKYGLTVDPETEAADINADGLVDIGDISLAAGNYGRSGPVSW